jgi:xylulokinase
MNPSDASITQLFNVATGDWDDALLALAGIRRDQLSAVRPSGYLVGGLTAAAGAETGLPEGLPVVNGAHDQYCAAVGLGITRPGPVMLSCGTAWVILAVPETLEAGFRGDMRISRHAVEGRWGAILSLGGVGRSLEWLVDNVWGSGEATAARPVLYEAVNQAAARAPAGAAGLLCFPLAGGHAETVGAGGGGFVGLTLAHGRDEMARAVMEGVACELRRSLEAIQAAGVRVNELTMVGGAARSPIWPQIVADVTGIPVVLPGITEAASWGAAVLAGVGVGLFPSAETAAVSDFGSLAPGRRCNPIPEHGPVYAEVYERYRRFCRLLFE